MRPAALCEESCKRGVPASTNYSGNKSCSSRVHKGMSYPGPEGLEKDGPQELAGVTHDHIREHTRR